MLANFAGEAVTLLAASCQGELSPHIFLLYFFYHRQLRASPVASLKKRPAQMIWGTFRTAPDKKRSKICTEKRPFPAVSLKQRPDACILIEGTTPCGKSR
jgi:hypothetical protein